MLQVSLLWNDADTMKCSILHKFELNTGATTVMNASSSSCSSLHSDLQQLRILKPQA